MITFDINRFNVGIDTILQQIKKSEWMPDLIVGITRGGLIPAVYLSHRLDVPLVCYDPKPKLHLDISDFNVYPKILVVDEIIDSGSTIKELLDIFQGIGYNCEFRTACLVVNTAQDFKPDYLTYVIDRKNETAFIKFPWEKE